MKFYILLPSDKKVGPSNIAMSIADIISHEIDVEVLSLYHDNTSTSDQNYEVINLSYSKLKFASQIISCIRLFSSNNSVFIVNSHGVRPLIVLYLAKFFNKNMRIIHSQHVYDKDDLFVRHSGLKSRVYLYLRKFIYSIPDQIVVATSPLEVEYYKDGISTVVINNFTKFDSNPVRYSNVVNVNFMANLISLKRPMMLVNALVDLNLPNVKLNIFGEGPLFEGINNKLEVSGVDYHMFGNVVNASEHYFNVGDLFVHPSSHEGMSIAVLEAMSKGAVVVLADIPGNSEFKKIASKGIYFFSEQSELNDILLELCSLEKSVLEDMGKSVFYGARELFSEERIKSSWLRLISDA